MSNLRTYLGDSVYAELQDDGMIKLTTNNGYDDDPRNIIYMERAVLEAFWTWTLEISGEKHRRANDPS